MSQVFFLLLDLHSDLYSSGWENHTIGGVWSLRHPFTSARIDLHLSEGTFAGAEEEADRHFILRKYSSGFIFLAFPYASLEVSGATSTTLLSAVVFFDSPSAL